MRLHGHSFSDPKSQYHPFQKKKKNFEFKHTQKITMSDAPSPKLVQQMDQPQLKSPDTDHNKKPESPVLDPNPKSADAPAPNGDGDNWTTFDIGSESQKIETQTQAQSGIQSEQSPNQSSGSRKSVHWSPELVTESHASKNNHNEENTMYVQDRSNPYIVDRSPAPPESSSSIKDKMATVKDVLGRWGKKVGEATRKAEDLAGNTWQHCEFLFFFLFFGFGFENRVAF
ncbi:hypothetical protein EZV62_014692 [Acer yangbiense]|uniref:Uncharacterized protein n=1 Tax=Acer yangbiense TaxID=1000413 RepID=A0A5C7HTR5_9ROSI|nr:hypothetical protein EZV62_014692 [Acer yangbiense]